MIVSLDSQMSAVSLDGKQDAQRTPFGKEMLKHFLFDPAHRNLNHGSFGAFPRSVQEKLRQYQDRCELHPDQFILYETPRMLDDAREAMAELLRVPASTVVLVPNATTGVNTVLRNLLWNQDGTDEILYFNTIYGACGLTVDYVVESNRKIVNSRKITLDYPIEDKDLLDLFKNAIRASKAEQKTPRIAIFDTISSVPGVRVPFKELTKICRDEGVLSLVDAAHGAGQIGLSIPEFDPDFLVSNLHKWLFVPRGCAVFYVPERNQHLIRSTLPTSHGFVSRSGFPKSSVLPPNEQSEFVNNFQYVATIDNTNYLMVPEALKFRKDVCGGEDALIGYITKLAREGGALVAEILGTKIMENSTQTLTDCAMVNILLPLTADPEKFPHANVVKPEDVMPATQWMKNTLIAKHKTFLFVYFLQGQWWVRLSAQVYLDVSDFEWAGNTLKDLCDRMGKGEHVNAAAAQVNGNAAIGEVLQNGVAS